MTYRVALYALPGAGAGDDVAELLRSRAEAWLGRRADGSLPEASTPPGWNRSELDAVTVQARRYGFHGTLKAPFRLAPGRTLEELTAGVSRFASDRTAVDVPDLALLRLSGFFALVAGRPAAALHALADALVTTFDDFRAPLTEAETARRDPAGLTPRQRELLDAWGYPYVLEEFRFHLTLTDRVSPALEPRVLAALTGWFAPVLGRPVLLDAVAVFTEEAPGAPFLLHSLHPFRPAPATELPHLETGRVR